MQLRAGCYVLPARQPAHELCRCYGLNLLPENAKRKAMNACQQTPVTPLDHSVMAPELAAQNGSFGFETEQGNVDLVRRLMQTGRKLLGGNRSRVHHPAGHHGEAGIVGDR